MKKLGIILIPLLSACSIAPEAINYGSDQCHYCKMNIVDQQHAAQYVTKKGKQFKFDAIECMIYELGENEAPELSHLLVADYDQPANMIQASSAHFLISDEIKSPMGAFLSAFSNGENAEVLREKHGGKLYNWDEINAHFNEN